MESQQTVIVRKYELREVTHFSLVHTLEQIQIQKFEDYREQGRFSYCLVFPYSHNGNHLNSLTPLKDVHTYLSMVLSQFKGVCRYQVSVDSLNKRLLVTGFYVDYILERLLDLFKQPISQQPQRGTYYAN